MNSGKSTLIRSIIQSYWKSNDKHEVILYWFSSLCYTSSAAKDSPAFFKTDKSADIETQAFFDQNLEKKKVLFESSTFEIGVDYLLEELIKKSEGREKYKKF